MKKPVEASPDASGRDQSIPDQSRRSFLAGTAGALAGPAVKALGAIAVGTASAGVIAQTSGKAKIVAKYGHDSGPGSGLQYFGEYFAGRMSQLTDGEVEVQVFPNSQLGSTTEMAQAVKQGTLEFALPTGVLAGSVITPELGVFGLPYLIKSWQQATRVEYSQAAELLRERASRKGVHVLAFAPNALRNLYYNTRSDKLVTKVEDVEGMKIRVIESPINVGAWAACGALPTPIAFNEVFNAMQQKVVNGVDNAFNSAVSIHLEEVINAVALTNHRYEVNLFITNESWFKSQPKRIQDAMQTAAREASIYQQGFVMWDDIRIPKLWATQKKIRTVVPDLSGFVKKMTSIYPKFEEKFGKDVMQLVEKV